MMNIEDIQKHSFKNYHVKGLDYLCIKRSPELTSKVYFFEGDVSKAPEVVNPHDHRYNFDTRVLTGRVQNSLYEECGKPSPHAVKYYAYNWHSPLVGGKGFENAGYSYLLETERRTYDKFHTWQSTWEEVHTLRILKDRTVLLLNQYRDKHDHSTMCYTKSSCAPNLSGLYEKFTNDEIIKKINLLKEIDDHTAKMFYKVKL